MGYAGVEFAGYFGRGPKELRTLLDDVGLQCCGSHIPIGTLLADEFPRTVRLTSTPSWGTSA
jgi:hypothetical protein